MTVNKIRRNGSYAPLSAHYYKDDAIDEAGEAAELLYVRGLAFCADVLSDGFISHRQLVRFVGVGMTDAAERAARLVEVGLWESVEGGYRVRSWLNWNRSREEITEYKAKDAARKAAGGAESAPPDATPPGGGGKPSGTTPNGIRTEDAAESERSPNGVRPHAGARARTPRNSTPLHEQQHLLVIADATTDEAPPAVKAVEPDEDEEFEAWWAVWPRKVAKGGAKKSYKAARKKVSAAQLLTAATNQAAAWKATGKAAEFIPHATTWLNQERYNDEIERPKFTVINNPDSPWAGMRIDNSESPWAADMGWTS